MVPKLCAGPGPLQPAGKTHLGWFDILHYQVQENHPHQAQQGKDDQTDGIPGDPLTDHRLEIVLVETFLKYLHTFASHSHVDCVLVFRK